MTEVEIKDIEKQIKQQINDIVEFSKTSPEPCESELTTDIYN